VPGTVLIAPYVENGSWHRFLSPITWSSRHKDGGTPMRHFRRFLPLAIAVLCVGVMVCDRCMRPESEKEAETVLCQRRLGKDRDLVVIRGPRRPGTDAAPFHLPYPNSNRIKAIFPVRVELRSGQAGGVMLASRPIVETESWRQPGFEVLDMLADDRRIVICATSSGGIILWVIHPFTEPDHFTALDQREWTRFAGLVSIDRATVSAKLRWTKTGLVEVAIDDLRPDFKQHTLFLESEKEWKFLPSSE
jgi:hypothetical protein